jgi:hypothetical protein
MFRKKQDELPSRPTNTSEQPKPTRDVRGIPPLGCLASRLGCIPRCCLLFTAPWIGIICQGAEAHGARERIGVTERRACCRKEASSGHSTRARSQDGRRSYKTQYRKVVLGAMVAFQSGPGLATLLGAPRQFAEEMGVKGRASVQGKFSREMHATRPWDRQLATSGT